MIVRLATSADASVIAVIYRPFVVSTAVSFELEPPDASEMARRLEEVTPRHPWLVAQRDAHVVGYAYAAPFRARAAYDWSVEVSVYVGEGARRQGVARNLYDVLHALLRAQGFHRAIAGMTLPNPASAGFHESLGYRQVGVFPSVGYKLGAWHDVGFWALDLAAPSTPPRPLRSLADLDAAELSAALDTSSLLR